MARPTKYTNEVIPMIAQYIATTGKEQMELPTLEGLAIYLSVHTDTIQEWVKVHPEFSVAIKEILARQKTQLMNDGLYGGKEVNSTMAIFLLKVNHGMKEASQLDITSQGEKVGGPIIYLPQEDGK